MNRVAADARQQGFQEGLAAGRSEAEAQVKPVLDRLARGIANLAGLETRIRRQSEEDLVQLALAIARRIVHRELNVHPESIQGIVKVALDRLGARDIRRVHVHPGHEQIVRDYLARAGSSAIIEADPALELGDAVFETSKGMLDATIESQLAEIERGFADRLGR
jgi:flagellar assembly protein FliH